MIKSDYQTKSITNQNEEELKKITWNIGLKEKVITWLYPSWHLKYWNY